MTPFEKKVVALRLTAQLPKKRAEALHILRMVAALQDSFLHRKGGGGDMEDILKQGRVNLFERRANRGESSEWAQAGKSAGDSSAPATRRWKRFFSGLPAAPSGLATSPLMPHRR
jgi:hypothetical protein